MTSRPDGAPVGPTVRGMLLGVQLRRLRESKGVSRETAAWEIRASESEISRMELGRVGFKESDIAHLLTLYGVVDRYERAALLNLARQANKPGWWHTYGDLLPSWFQAYLGLESATALVRAYEVQFIPGLLQTRDYAQAVVKLGHNHAQSEEVERRVDLRMARQQLLARPDARLWAVVDEAALRRPIGGHGVMRAQIASLIDAVKLPNVTLQIVPFHVGGHAAAGGGFTILRFPEQDLPDVVYIEHLTSALYLDKRDDVDQYTDAMERLCVQAEPPDRTPEILAGILHDHHASPVITASTTDRKPDHGVRNRQAPCIPTYQPRAIKQ